MSATRFAEVERVCQAALDEPPDRRAAFLDEACAGDALLRAEVDSLLAGATRADSFLHSWTGGVHPRLDAGAQIGPYQIVSLLGAGGMGEVYEARDTRLHRAVAVKVLASGFASDPERRARFEREARTIAALNHPHICTLYDVGEADGTTYLVMEHLDGESLADRVQKGRLPLEQAIDIATQIADALTAAHRHGIVHRDLKPANVMLTRTGAARPGSPQAKLLDFGLAKLRRPDADVGSLSATMPARPEPLTGRGVIVGTLPYMAPEQIEGRDADARSDIWALGAILYEMLTGARAFEGTSGASLIGNILYVEPPAIAMRQPLAPPALERLVRRCLAKQPDDRWDSAHDLADELRWIRESSGASVQGGAPVQGGDHRPRARAALVIAALVGGAMLGAATTWLLRPVPSRLHMARPSVDVRPADEVKSGGVFGNPTRGGSRTALTWTPDGQALVFVGRRGGVQQLYVRRLDAMEARALANTEGAQVPAVSPDGQSVAFWAAQAIKKVPIAGGPAMELAAGVVRAPKGLTWSADGSVLFSGDDGRIWTIPPGGAATPFSTLGRDEVEHTLPWPLPEDRWFLYTVRRRNITWGDEERAATHHHHQHADRARRVDVRPRSRDADAACVERRGELSGMVAGWPAPRVRLAGARPAWARAPSF